MVRSTVVQYGRSIKEFANDWLPTNCSCINNKRLPTLHLKVHPQHPQALLQPTKKQASSHSQSANIVWDTCRWWSVCRHGGLAAPVLASALSALCVATHTADAIAATLTSTAALTSMFGVVGGGFTAYKFKRHTDGLSDKWRMRKETKMHHVSSTKNKQLEP